MRYAILTLIFTATFLVSPAFTSFTGFEASQLPIPQVNPPIQPAGYAFSIWGLIYAWLAASAIFGILKRADDPAWERPRKFLIVSLAIGTPWLWVATQSPIWATVLIIAMAGFAIAALLTAPRLFDRLWFQTPVALYAGWLTAASFVSLGSTLAGYGILMDSWGWALTGITGALIVSVAVYWQRKSAPEYLFPVIWALVGIIVANGYDVIAVSYLAAAGIIALLVVLGAAQVMRRGFRASLDVSTSGTAG